MDSAYGLVQFWLSLEFFSSNHFQIGQHVVPLHIQIVSLSTRITLIYLLSMTTLVETTSWYYILFSNTEASSVVFLFDNVDNNNINFKGSSLEEKIRSNLFMLFVSYSEFQTKRIEKRYLNYYGMTYCTSLKKKDKNLGLRDKNILKRFYCYTNIFSAL